MPVVDGFFLVDGHLPDRHALIGKPRRDRTLLRLALTLQLLQ